MFTIIDNNWVWQVFPLKVSQGFGVSNEKMFFPKETKQVDSASFQQILKDTKTQFAKEHLTTLMDGIQKQGERLVRSRTLADLQRYKKLIKTFLQEVVKFGLSLEVTASFTPMNRGRRLKIIKEIDRQLLELSQEILEKEDANIRLLDKIGEIKGLLIDLYLWHSTRSKGWTHVKRFVMICAILAVLSAGGLFGYQYLKKNPGTTKEMTLDQLAEQTIQTEPISTNLNSDNLIQVRFSIELDSKKTKKQSEKVVPIIESDIIKLLSQSNKEDFKDIASIEQKLKDRLNQRFSQGKIINVYTTELLIQ